MKHIKIFEEFNLEDDVYDDDPLSNAEQHFGRKTILQKKFSKIVVDGLCSNNKRISKFWSTFNALLISIKDMIDENSDEYKELMHKIIEGEDPIKVVNDVCKTLTNNSEINILLQKLNGVR